jgi:VWFA-related protein
MLSPAVTSKSKPDNSKSASRCHSGLRLFVIFCALLALTSVGPANLRAQDPPLDDEVVRVSTDLLLFPIRIRDKTRQPARLLTETDLVLKDNDHVTTGLYFYPGADRVALVFALDQSGSLQKIISRQREAALGLFAKFSARSRVAVIRFAESAIVTAPFGRDTGTARDAFDFIGRANQHTAIFDAAAVAVTTFDPLPRVRSERRIVILISDGLDNASRTKPGAVIEAALNKRVSFYVIHLPLFEPRDGRLAVRTPARGFRDLAEKTGGKYFLAGDARTALAPPTEIDLAPIFGAIEDDLKSQYLLGFYLGEAANDGRKHRFSLGLPAGIEYQVGRLGYSRTHGFFVHRPREALKTRN